MSKPDGVMSLEDMRERLSEHGWTLAPQDMLRHQRVEWTATKRIEGLPNCVQGSPAPPFVLLPYRLPGDGERWYESVTVRIIGDTPGGWVELKVYGLSVDFSAIEKACETLAAAWRAAATS